MQLNQIKLDNYNGPWCIEPVYFSQMVDRVNSMNLAAHVERQDIGSFDATAKGFDVVDGGGVAVIDIMGTMTKAGSSLGGGGTVQARRAIRQAENDSSVSAILLRFDTPGGTVSGTQDLANEVARTSKPIYAYVEDLCASAGMWVASQCDRIYANSTTAKIGSIGTFMGLYDISGALENENVKTVVVKAGQFKGGGFPGMEISDEQIAEWQKVIDATQTEFTKGIASGRKMSLPQAQQLVTGLVYIAQEAESLNLIDGIKSFDEVVEELRGQTPKGVASMADTNKPTAATFKEIVAACPGIDSANAVDALFISECLGAEMSSEDATAQYCQSLRDRLEASEAKVSELSAENAELKASAVKPKGAKTVGTQGDLKSADPVSDWNAAIRKEQEGGLSRAAAVRAVNNKNPELREAMVAACN